MRHRLQNPEANATYQVPAMNHDLQTFVFSILRVVVPTLFVVASAAFVAIPFSLGHHPGDARPVAAASHLT